jgi:HD-GYP domain-containing protein (c-di-GMP phosphodiesterase class II)
MLKTIIIIIILTEFISIVFLFIRNRSLKNKLQRAKFYLKNTETKLHNNVMDVDNLVLMLTSIHEFGSLASEIASKTGLVNLIIETACNLLNSQMGSLMLINQNNELYIVAAKGLSKEVIENTKMKIGEGIAGMVVSTGKYYFVEDIETDVRFLRPNLEEKYETKSFISVPLKIKNKVIGVLNINSSKNNKKFTQRDVELLTLLADNSAITIENLELFTDLQSFYFEMIQTLARALDAKDSYTHDHADRAGKYAKLIAQEMNLPDTVVRYIEYAALLHDIGKIGISDNILLKKGKLADDEQQIIRQHPIIGYKIILPVKYLYPIAPLVLYHHERYDGSGYPEGLSGEEIPLGARIVAIIDAFDAMTSDRPYRKAPSVKTAINELKKGMGKQFDPRIVKIFLDILSREKII